VEGSGPGMVRGTAVVFAYRDYAKQISSQCSRRQSNRVPPDYKSEALYLQSTYSIDGIKPIHLISQQPVSLLDIHLNIIHQLHMKPL
jgi:hypothetical protein